MGTGGSPAEIVEREGLAQVERSGAVEAYVARCSRRSEKSVADYRAGKTNVLQFLNGQVMKTSGGKADPSSSRNC